MTKRKIERKTKGKQEQLRKKVFKRRRTGLIKEFLKFRSKEGGIE